MAKSKKIKPQSRADEERHNPQNHTFGVHGVRLKHFEQVVANLLPEIEPRYVRLPTVLPKTWTTTQPTTLTTSHNGGKHTVIETNDSDEKDENSDNEWPFATLPVAARVWGNLPGQLVHEKRALKKEGQLRSMLRCILPLVPLIRQRQHHGQTGRASVPTIVDFGGGSGHLAIPLALMLPDCRIVVVDLNQRSLDLMHEKAAKVMEELQASVHGESNGDSHSTWTATAQQAAPEASMNNNNNNNNDPRFRRCWNNLLSFVGPVQDFDEPFDMALALHLCGEATDVGLRKAANMGASAMVVAPCCVGKLSRRVLNPDVYHATGTNLATVSYPQSETFCQLIRASINHHNKTDDADSALKAENDWNALAKAADYSNEQEVRTSRNATRRTAKALLETDRRLFLETRYGYQTALTRMEPLEVTPKNDILVAWKVSNDYNNQLNNLFARPNAECQADIEVAKSHLLKTDKDQNADQKSSPAVDKSDWSHEEEVEMETTLLDFLERTKNMDNALDEVFIFPTRMGGRKRKLIHFMAGVQGLAHWSVGSKDRDKTVAVARRGQRKRKQESQQDYEQLG